MILATERRSSPRHPAVNNRVVVHIRDDRESRLVMATLINVSRTGALLSMSEKVARNATVHIRLEYPIATDWIRGQVIRRTRAGHVGVLFRRPRDRTFFWTATRGQDFHSPSRPWSDSVLEASTDNHAGSAITPACAWPLPVWDGKLARNVGTWRLKRRDPSWPQSLSMADRGGPRRVLAEYR